MFFPGENNFTPPPQKKNPPKIQLIYIISPPPPKKKKKNQPGTVVGESPDLRSDNINLPIDWDGGTL